MNTRASVSATAERTTITVRVPLSIRTYGGRKRIISPAETPETRRPYPQVDSTIVKALARARRWERLLDSGAYTSIAELAAAERINASYLARVLRMTLLAPDIIEVLLNGSPVLPITLQDLLAPFPLSWDLQRAQWIKA